LEVGRAVERLPSQAADHGEHRYGDEHLEQGKPAAHCESPSPVTRWVPACAGRPGWRPGWSCCGAGDCVTWPAFPTESGRMTISCDAEMLRSSLPSFQLTVTRTSRTLFFSVSRNPCACPCR